MLSLFFLLAHIHQPLHFTVMQHAVILGVANIQLGITVPAELTAAVNIMLTDGYRCVA